MRVTIIPISNIKNEARVSWETNCALLSFSTEGAMEGKGRERIPILSLSYMPVLYWVQTPLESEERRKKKEERRKKERRKKKEESYLVMRHA